MAALKPLVSFQGRFRAGGTIDAMRRLFSHALPAALLLSATFLSAAPASAQGAPDKRSATVRGGIPYATREDAMQFADEDEAIGDGR